MSPPPIHYYSQPPPVNPPSHQRQSYHQPPPMNPSQYNISMTSDFDPFNDFRDGPSRREPSVERELPLYDYEDDEIDFVPETQFQNTIGYFFYNRQFFFVFHISPYFHD